MNERVADVTPSLIRGWEQGSWCEGTHRAVQRAPSNTRAPWLSHRLDIASVKLLMLCKTKTEQTKPLKPWLVTGQGNIIMEKNWRQSRNKNVTQWPSRFTVNHRTKNWPPVGRNLLLLHYFVRTTWLLFLLQTKIAKVHFYLSSKRNDQDWMCKWHVTGPAGAEVHRENRPLLGPARAEVHRNADPVAPSRDDHDPLLAPSSSTLKLYVDENNWSLISNLCEVICPVFAWILAPYSNHAKTENGKEYTAIASWLFGSSEFLASRIFQNMLFFFSSASQPRVAKSRSWSILRSKSFLGESKPLEHCPRILKIAFNNEKCFLFRGNPNYSRLPHSLPLGLQGVKCVGPSPVTSQEVRSKGGGHLTPSTCAGIASVYHWGNLRLETFSHPTWAPRIRHFLCSVLPGCSSGCDLRTSSWSWVDVLCSGLSLWDPRVA